MNSALQKSEPQMGVVPSDVSAAALQTALAGDLSRMNEHDRLRFYGSLCQFTGLNPLSKPFDWLTFQGKLTLYANKGCAEQLRKIHKVSVDIIERKVEFGCLIVRVKATDEDGRHDEALAAVPWGERMGGDAAAQAMMKCETKAKRRVTFSICGLSMILDREDDANGVKVEHVNIAATAETATDIAAKFNASLTDGQKQAAVEAEIVEPETKTPPKGGTPNGEDDSPFEHPTAPAHVAPPAENSQPAPRELTEIEKLAREVELVLSERPGTAVAYLVAKGHLQKGADLITMDKTFMEKILRQAKKFIKAVDDWKLLEQSK